MASEAEAIEAGVRGFARGLELHLRAERPDLSWEVSVGPVDWDELARLKSGSDDAGRGRADAVVT